MACISIVNPETDNFWLKNGPTGDPRGVFSNHGINFCLADFYIGQNVNGQYKRAAAVF